MLFLLVSFLSFILFLSKPLPLFIILPSWVHEMRLLYVLLCQEFLFHSLKWLKNCRLNCAQVVRSSIQMVITSRKCVLRAENVKEETMMTVLDLPDLALEHILGKLPPAGLCGMANVCRSLRDRCTSDHLWERHMREKWERVIGRAALREWELCVESKKAASGTGITGSGRLNWWMVPLSCIWPDSGRKPRRTSLRADSIMARYLALESGRFWFPAQVYNREQNGHVGFMLSCYDAELSYDSHTDTFYARYPPHGQRTTNIEEGVQWDRLREPPLSTPAHDLHVSDCLNDLHPGDHIEIQWRRNKEFPYGWWYGVVGHLDSCDGNERHCRCFNSDTIILEFNQYTPGSRWRQAVVNRKDHREEGNETDGFYGGIRKLHTKDEVSKWRRMWPNEVLQ